MKAEKKLSVDPRIVRTRQLIRHAFVELLEEMDLEKLSVHKIAERATINRVTFYQHYRDLTDMMEKMADDMIEQIQQIIKDHGPFHEEKSNEEPWPILVKLFDHISENAKFYLVVLATKRIPVFTERLLDLLSTLVQEKLESASIKSVLEQSDIHKQVAQWHCSSALIGTIVAWLRHDMPFPPHMMAKQFLLIRSLSYK